MNYAVTVDFTATVGIQADSREDAEAQGQNIDVTEVAGRCVARVVHVELQARTIRLFDIEGCARKSGVDDQGNHWVEFEVGALVIQEPGTCVECGAELQAGWMCLDGGDEMCSDHVEVMA